MSEIPQYMNRIQHVAASCRPRPMIDQIIERWEMFETHCALFKYDVFDRDEAQLRSRIRELITLLYQLGIGSVEDDIAQLRVKNAAYGGSWCKRGGTGAFHMLARKADRLIEQMRKHDGDFVTALADEESGEMLSDTIGDLRRYLILVEAWHDDRDTEDPDE